MKRGWTTISVVVVAGFVAGIVVGRLLERNSREVGSIPERGMTAQRQPIEEGNGSEAALLNKQEARLGRSLAEIGTVNGSSLYNIDIYYRYKKIFESHRGSIDGARVLEIGPGINLDSPARTPFAEVF